MSYTLLAQKDVHVDSKKDMHVDASYLCLQIDKRLSEVTGQYREKSLSPPVKRFYWPFQGSASFVDHIWLFIFCVFIAALPSPAGKDLPLGSLVCEVLLCFCQFSMWYPGSGVVFHCIDS